MAATSTQRVRVGGSGYTIFAFAGQPITFCQQVAHTSPQFVGNGTSAIQPMDEPYPIEILVPAAAGMGQLTLNLLDLYGTGASGPAGMSKVWDRLGAPVGGGSNANPFGSQTITNASTSLQLGNGPFAGLVDIVDIAIAQSQLDPTALRIVKYIRPLAVGVLPTSFGAPSATTPYYESYEGCVITQVVDGENVEVGTLEIIKQVTIAYRYMTRNGTLSQAFALRDNALS